METIALSVLMTKEDYIQFTVQLHRKQRARGLSFYAVVGGVLAILSLAGIFFGDRISLSPITAGCLLIFGVFLLCYDGAVAPILDKGAAAREYEEKEELRTANQYIFTKTAVQIRNSRLEGTLPLTLLTGWTQTADGFRLSFGRECPILIPRRLLTDDQCRLLEQWLSADKADK